MPRLVDRTHEIRGRLRVIQQAPSRGRRVFWKCLCDTDLGGCGTEKEVSANLLARGEARSCGCLRREAVAGLRRSHGASKTREHRIWKAMIRRCSAPKDISYRNYGGRGIAVCERWRNSFEAFRSDMGKCPPGHSIEREKNSLGYEPKNCVWATRAKQNGNTRVAIRIMFNGQEMCLAEAARAAGRNYRTVAARRARGKPQSEWFA